MTAMGRQEEWEDSPEGYPRSKPYKWWNWNDSYVPGAAPEPEWVEVSDAGVEAFVTARANAMSSILDCESASPEIVDRGTFQVALDGLRFERRPTEERR
jgi:hypothetical protein